MVYNNPFSLEGKTILVTGASSGIGKSIAIACSQMGGTLIITGRNEGRLQETLNQLSGSGHLAIPGDLTNAEDRHRIASTTPALDGVVHCAGIAHTKMCKQIEESDLETVMGINFNAPVLLQKELQCCRKINKKGSIVFISSIAVTKAIVANSLYSASKGAITSYANCLQLELAQRQIRVNTVHPAMVWTDLVYNSVLGEEELKADMEKYPLKRYGNPEDVAYLVVYLLSDASQWMTGNHIEITGGYR